MDRQLRSIGRLLSRHSAFVLAVVVAVSAVLAVGLRRLEFATGQDSYLQPTSRAAIDNHRYQGLFGGEDMVVLFTAAEGKSVVDLFSAANLKAFDDLTATLKENKDLDSVITPATALTWTQDLVTSGTATTILSRAIARDPDPAGVQARTADVTLTLKRLAAAGEPSLERPEWVSFLLFDNTGFHLDSSGNLVAPPDGDLQIRKALRSFFPDPHHALLLGVVTGNASLDQLKGASDGVKAALAGRSFDNATFIVTGTPTFLTDINDYLQGGMLSLGGVAVVVMLVVLAVVFSVRWRLLPLVAVLVGVLWGFGLFGYLGIDLSLVTISGLPILIGIGVEFAIQIHNRVEEECALDRSANPFAETLAALGPALLVATVSAVIAFLVMRVSRVPMIQDFGVLLSVGIVMLLVTGVVVPLAVLGARERRRPTGEIHDRGPTERLLHWLGSLPQASVLPIAIGAIALPILGLALENRSEIQSDPINWANQSTATIRNARQLERDVHFATTLGIFVETTGNAERGVFTDQLSAFVDDFVARELAAEPTLVQASSLPTTVSYLIEVPGSTHLAPTGEDLLAAYTLAPPPIQHLLVGDDGNAAQVLFQVGPSSLEERAALLDRIGASIADPGAGAKLPSNAQATPAGLVVVGVGLLDNLTANRVALSVVAIALVLGWLVFRFRDLVWAAVTMVPVLFAVGASATLVAILGITLSPLTTVSGPLVVATCAEFSVLLTSRYEEERHRGSPPREATALASRWTGRAFIASALTTIGGFAVLMFSSLPLLADFGAVVTLNVAVAVLSALVLVPPLAIWVDERGWLPSEAPADRGPRATRQPIVALAGGAIIVAAGAVLALGAVRERSEAAASVLTVPATDVPATLPPPTTAAPPASAGDAPPAPTAPATTMPPGPPEKPTGLVAGAFYDALTGAGVSPGVARCAADALIAKTPEADLITMGVTQIPRPAAVNALLAEAALACGVPSSTLDALAG